MGKEDEDEDLAGGSSQRWAADEETAMWDEKAMTDSGYTDLAKDIAAKPRVETGPATTRDHGGEDKAKVKVGANVAAAAPAAKPAAGPSIVSWVVTIVIAITVGVAVFFAIRLLRG